MPLDYKPDDEVQFSAHDFLYGLDTGPTKPRAYFFQNIAAPLKAAGEIWHGHHGDSHKIDCLTQGLGPKPPEELVVMPSSTLTTEIMKWRATAAKSGLQDGWDTTVTRQKNEFRVQDQVDYITWIKDTRYSPALSGAPEQWNARFKRTSKAGLFWALFVKGYGIHFIMSEDFDYKIVVTGSSSHPDYSAFTKKYGASERDEAVDVVEKRITWAEMRWIYRHREYAAVASRVQFWEMPDAYECRAVPAPWIDPSSKDVWAEYKPKFEKRDESEDGMGALLKLIGKDQIPVGPRPITCALVKDGKLDLLDTIFFQPTG